MKRSLLFGVLCALLLSTSSCQLRTMRPEVDVSIENKSSHDLENVRARFGDYVCSWGLVGGGAKKIYGQYPHPITPNTELHWDVAGQPKVQKFDLRKIYPKGKSGRLSFTIYDDRAEVSFRESPPAK